MASWVAKWLEHQTPDRRAWVQCSMPPNTLRIDTKNMLAKSLDPKVLWVVAAKTISAVDWRMFSFPPVPCLNCGGGDRWYRHISFRNPTCLGSRNFHSFPSGKTQQQHHVQCC
ncbi:hypothetical protein TNCV_4815891 [Trichonephila clavipes]|nr:hypothetical protein TNCV_4815891 [Trichonephila clavipes]